MIAGFGGRGETDRQALVNVHNDQLCDAEETLFTKSKSHSSF